MAYECGVPRVRLHWGRSIPETSSCSRGIDEGHGGQPSFNSIRILVSASRYPSNPNSTTMETGQTPTLLQGNPTDTLKYYAEHDPVIELGVLAKQSRKPALNLKEQIVTLGYTAFTVMTCQQLMRVSFPLIYQLVGTIGFTYTPLVAASVFILSPFLVPLSKLIPGNAGLPLALSVTLCVLIRLVMQIVTFSNGSGEALSLPYAIAGMIASLWTWILLIGTMLDLPRDSRSIVGPMDGALFLTAGTVLGQSLDSLVRACWITYDPVWNPSGAAMAVSVLLLVVQLVLCALFTWYISPIHVKLGEPKRGRFGRVFAYAVILQPQFIFFQSQAFLASQGPMSTYLAAGIVIGTGGITLIFLDLLAIWIWVRGSKHTLVETRKPWRFARVLAICFALPLVAIAAIVPIFPGAALAACLVVFGQVLTGLFMYCVLCEEPWTPRGKPKAYWLTFGGGLVGFLVWFALLLLYPLHYELNLPFPNWVLGMVAVLMAMLGLFEQRWSSARSMLQECMELSETPKQSLSYSITEDLDPVDSTRLWPKGLAERALPWLGGITLASAIVTGCAIAGAQATQPIPKPATWPISYVTYNTAMGRSDTTGAIAFEELGNEIEALGKDIVCCQEVGRGWPLNGMSDFGAYLQHRFNYESFFVPAADNQFGNMILSRVPFTDATLIPLPQGGGSMKRSALRITVNVQGTSTNVYCTHLAHRNTEATIAARKAQMETILADWNKYPYAIIGGDFNPQNPDLYADLKVMIDAGLTTTQNVKNCTMPTSGENCSDFIFLSEGLYFDPAVYTTDSQITDHKPAIGTVWKK